MIESLELALTGRMKLIVGLLIALLLLGEIPSLREALGCAIILGAVLISQLREGKEA